MTAAPSSSAAARRYDVIVVGGGHAGTEAALAAARSGARTLLLTQSIETLGQMSCNPAIGGIGKGHLVKEIDALGGLMARAADASGIHWRTLNASKGPAVRATRAQADRQLYKAFVRRALEWQDNLEIFQAEAADLRLAGTRVAGVVTRVGLCFESPTVVLTAGTFLAGRIHVGLENHAGGRAGDAPSLHLSARLRELMPRTGRLKTGTPPRLDGRTIDYARLAHQPGDEPRPVFSFLGRAGDHPAQVVCHITRTNARTHEIIRAGFDQSPMYQGVIEGTGPRYCPSVEDKVSRFGDRDGHQIFIEPEGLSTTEVYPNGISTSLPFAVQEAFVRSIAGFEHARITRPGYAIEYDYFDPRDLHRSLETRTVEGLFFAGQINGTTGYEEAAAQGLLAGLNAARAARGEAAWVPERHQAYLGVLADDLTTRGTSEPYRMFTSRAEHRLRLREDNADARLTPVGRALGLVDDARWAAFEAKQAAVSAERARLAALRLKPAELARPAVVAVFGPAPQHHGLAGPDLLRRPEGSYAVLKALGFAPVELDPVVAEQVEIDIKYAGYLERGEVELARTARYDAAPLPADLDYARIGGLSTEIHQKLATARPDTLGQAGRIPGVTPAAVALLLVHLKKTGQLSRGGEGEAVSSGSTGPVSAATA